jgi:hypothetical protein
MKLSQPGSSSDIEAAREAAQRLNRVATPPEPARPLPPYTPVASGFHTMEPSRPAPVAVPPPPPVAPPPVVSAPPLPTPVAVEPPKPAPAWQRYSEPEPPPLPEPDAAPEPEPEPEPVSAAPNVASEPPPPAAAEAVVEESVEPEPSPVPAAPVAAPAPVAAAPADVIEEEALGVADEAPAAAAPLSWPDVTRSCLVLAEAKGALLIAPEGRVIAVAGDWPPPGAEAIASRLVPAMDKALKDAPTRSVSVPLGGLHLTAWRVPVDSGGLMTVGFVADTPLRPDLRPGIDAELRKGGEA